MGVVIERFKQCTELIAYEVNVVGRGLYMWSVNTKMEVGKARGSIKLKPKKEEKRKEKEKEKKGGERSKI